MVVASGACVITETVKAISVWPLLCPFAKYIQRDRPCMVPGCRLYMLRGSILELTSEAWKWVHVPMATISPTGCC